ncbi:hypothetical protein AABB24_038302 [Solanum stoloniferum]|uniref:PilZ domain-containing protein n=1 Tax=Solanum stoloniferum TaxID=62892 RepID=A0ABD2QX12_9SOLN
MGNYLWGKIRRFRGEIRIENLNSFSSVQGHSRRDLEIPKKRGKGDGDVIAVPGATAFLDLSGFGLCLLEKKTLAYRVGSLGTELRGRRRTRKGSGFGIAIGSFEIVVENWVIWN